MKLIELQRCLTNVPERAPAETTAATKDSFLGSCLPVSMDPVREALETKVLAINPATKQNKLEE